MNQCTYRIAVINQCTHSTAVINYIHPQGAAWYAKRLIKYGREEEALIHYQNAIKASRAGDTTHLMLAGLYLQVLLVLYTALHSLYT
jgi:hypothetical protein